MRVTRRSADGGVLVVELGVLVLLVAGNLLQTFVVPERAQLLTGPLIAAAAVALALGSGLTRDDLGLGSRAVRAGARLGAAAVLVVAVALVAALLVPPVREAFVDPQVGALTAGSVRFDVLLRIPIATAGPEEVLFRGVVLALAVRRLGMRRGALLAAVLFGFWHIAPTLKDGGFDSAAAAAGAVVGVVAVTTLAALVFTWLRRRSGSVLAPFLAHWATNALGLLAVYAVSR